jgi:hypothetical protein
MNDRRDQQTQCVGEDMAFAAFDFLAGVITTRTAAFRGFHALAVDHSGAGRGFAAGGQTNQHDQKVIYRAP